MAVAKYWDTGMKSWLAVNSVGVRFYGESMSFYASTADFHLTYLPLPHSERVYKNGVYQREGIAWTRAIDTKTIKILAGMGMVSGDSINVEYAYSTVNDVIVTPPIPCDGTTAYPDIIILGTDPVSSIGEFDTVVISSSVPAKHVTYLDPTRKGAFFSPFTEQGPPLAPGSSNSWKMITTFSSASARLDVFPGELALKWPMATTLKASTWMKTDMPDPAYIFFRIEGNWGEQIGGSIGGFMYEFIYRPLEPIKWRTTILNKHFGVPGYPTLESVPMTGFTAAPNIANATYAEITVTPSTKTVVFKVGADTWTYTGPEVWPDSSDPVWSDQGPLDQYKEPTSSPDLSFVWAANTGFDHTITSFTDQMRIQTDVPWCEW